MRQNGVVILVLVLVLILGATAIVEATYIQEGCPHGMTRSYNEWALTAFKSRLKPSVYVQRGLPARRIRTSGGPHSRI